MSEARYGPDRSLDEFHSWWKELTERSAFRVERIPFADLRRWRMDPGTGDIRHDSGRFFTVEGLRVHSERGPVHSWSQPIINQPEIGILGILVKRFDGVPHYLMQCKMEPGNINVLQLSPTVQATRSNFTRAHQGSQVAYIEYFTDLRPDRVLVDVLQSEHGSWFLRKRNRNMIVEVEEEVPLRENFRWLTLDQIGELLRVDNLVNMDARTVLSCLPLSHTSGDAAADTALRSWFTEICATHNVRTQSIPLREVERWEHRADEIAHEDGHHFKVVAVSVRATTREVSSWTQPLFQPCGLGVVAFLIRRVAGEVQVLAHARAEPGFVDVVEIGPTVQYQPSSYPDGSPPFADLVRDAAPERIHYDTVLSEEGGRFRNAENRYMVLETDDDLPEPLPEDYRWLTLRQLTGLLAHRNYVNVQARTLVCAMRLTLGLS
ncbi:NDP-hexose 2,3-dehydratase family protein [Streptomyces lancefieldiae]|uniref:NDP-hexose 2,3-dehydratase family protein n=1 Tax=Streptomyces lancefieldiae TaxID=3075520 RepID=A0ABU3AM08_9ACTN|nr:NDP-hexose 2,3-dehydratase family protein [Streptomyces sp. DSM 40712]MDT0610820.1 NDP-hexose 2,3-dehydratase family protein [Streptomyces sp. DSM 40712]